MEKRVLTIFFLIFTFYGFAQKNQLEPSGKTFATIFANFHQGISGTAIDEGAFELVRGYVGYEYTFSREFYAKINVDVGSSDELPPNSKLRRYAYFKNAFLRYSENKLQIEFGLISLKQFKLQEKIWERRYLMKTLADEYNMGSSADLGINFHYQFNKKIDADFTMMSGEGYNSIQLDNIFKYAIGSTVRFPKNFTSRVYYDFSHNGIYETTLLLFTSCDFKNRLNLAGEFIFRNNNGWKQDCNIFGLSVFGKYNLNRKYQLFARFDKIHSNVLAGENNPWHLDKDGTALVAGIQFNPIKNIKMALNYHDWCSQAANNNREGFIYLNLEVKM